MDGYALLKPLLVVGSVGWVIYFFSQIPGKLAGISECWNSPNREGLRDELISFAFTGLITAALLIYYVIPAVNQFPFFHT